MDEIRHAVAAQVWLIVTLMLVGCAKTEVQPEPIRPVRALRVGDLNAISGREFTGRARAKVEVDLSFQVSGPLVALPVDVGSVVNKGDLIAGIDPRDFQTQLDSAQANLGRARANLLAMERGARPEEIEQLKAALEQAKGLYREAVAEHERDVKLLPQRAVTREEFDRSQARMESKAAEVKVAEENLNIGLAGARQEDLEAKRAEIRALEAAVTNAKNQLDYCVLKAPFDGEVVARYADNYQTVLSKQSIVRLVDLSEIEVTIQVPENLISLIPQVQKVACRFDAIPDREFDGEVSKIGSEASQTTRTYPVTIHIDQPEDVRILPGMAATVRNHPESIASATATHPVVPPGALFTNEDGQDTYVWVVDNDSKKVSRRTVKTGDLMPVGMEVTDGLQPGEWVVISGVNSLRGDQQVRLPQEGS